MGGGGSKFMNLRDRVNTLNAAKAESDWDLAAARAELARLHGYAKDKEKHLKEMTENKAKSDCELAATRAELAGLEKNLKEMTQNKAQSDKELVANQVKVAELRSSVNEKEIKLKEMIQNNEKSELELKELREKELELRDTIAKDKKRYAEGAMALVRHHDIMMNNIVANSKGGERLNPKKDLVIRILSELREDYFQEMIKWCLEVARGNVHVERGETILEFFNKRSGELVKEIKIIKGIVCTIRMEDELKQQIATHLESILKPAIDLDDKVRESRFALISDPKSFTLDHIKKCLDMVEEAAWVFPHMRTLEECIEDEKKEYKQSIDSTLSKMSIGN